MRRPFALIDNWAGFWPFLALIALNGNTTNAAICESRVLISDEPTAQGHALFLFPLNSALPRRPARKNLPSQKSRPTCWIIYAGLVKDTDDIEKRG
jgi:hypothetical protein